MNPTPPRFPAAALRYADASDADRVAALHTASWRAHYRGAFSDAYLDGPIETERLSVWRQRLQHPRAGQVVVLAETGRLLVGFVCFWLNHDRELGSFIDNLHVAVEHKGGGIGRRLMHEAGQAMLYAAPNRPAYLTVLEGNHPARRFYDRIGGSVTERGRTTEPDGSEVAVLRYVWANAAALIAGTESI